MSLGNRRLQRIVGFFLGGLLGCGLLLIAALASWQSLHDYTERLAHQLCGKTNIPQEEELEPSERWYICHILMACMATCWILVARALGVLPIIPTLLLAATSPPLSLLSSMAHEQLLNIGHALTIKAVKDNGGRHGASWVLSGSRNSFGGL